LVGATSISVVTRRLRESLVLKERTTTPGSSLSTEAQGHSLENPVASTHPEAQLWRQTGPLEGPSFTVETDRPFGGSFLHCGDRPFGSFLHRKEGSTGTFPFFDGYLGGAKNFPVTPKRNLS
jgi:hypothetical protein